MEVTRDGATSLTDGVHVSRGIPDENHLGWCTLHKLGYADPPPGSPKATAIAMLEILRNQSALGTVYATPLSKVTAPRPSPAFFKTARQEQLTWFRRLADRLFSMGRVKRHYARANPLFRQLEFTGVMIVNGRHIRPSEWSEPIPQPTHAPVVGQPFERLVVVENLPRGYSRCRCQCPAGNEITVRNKHLLAGRTTSCGCRRDELKAKIERRKAMRRR